MQVLLLYKWLVITCHHCLQLPSYIMTRKCWGGGDCYTHSPIVLIFSKWIDYWSLPGTSSFTPSTHHQAGMLVSPTAAWPSPILYGTGGCGICSSTNSLHVFIHHRLRACCVWFNETSFLGQFLTAKSQFDLEERGSSNLCSFPFILTANISFWLNLVSFTWRFPKTVVPLFIIHVNGIFPCQPSILGTPFVETRIQL